MGTRSTIDEARKVSVLRPIDQILIIQLEQVVAANLILVVSAESYHPKAYVDQARRGYLLD